MNYTAPESIEWDFRVFLFNPALEYIEWGFLVFMLDPAPEYIEWGLGFMLEPSSV